MLLGSGKPCQSEFKEIPDSAALAQAEAQAGAEAGKELLHSGRFNLRRLQSHHRENPQGHQESQVSEWPQLREKPESFLGFGSDQQVLHGLWCLQLGVPRCTNRRLNI